MAKVLIGCPTMDMVSVHFARSLVTLTKLEDCVISFVVNSLVYASRNEICRQAIDGGYDFVLWLDSDMVFPPDTMVRLLEVAENGNDVVTGLYFRRAAPFTPVLFSRLEITGNVCEMDEVKAYPGDLFEVAGCGFGCVLTSVKLLRTIEAEDGPVWFAPMGNVGEDCAFCIRARKHGSHILCDPTLKLGHAGHNIVTEADYERELNKPKA